MRDDANIANHFISLHCGKLDIENLWTSATGNGRMTLFYEAARVHACSRIESKFVLPQECRPRSTQGIDSARNIVRPAKPSLQIRRFCDWFVQCLYFSDELFDLPGRKPVLQ